MVVRIQMTAGDDEANESIVEQAIAELDKLVASGEPFNLHVICMEAETWREIRGE